MDNDTPILIKTVSNGFEVLPEYAQISPDISPNETKVFQSFAELIKYLSQHFTYRNQEFEPDKNNDLGNWNYDPPFPESIKPIIRELIKDYIIFAPGEPINIPYIDNGLKYFKFTKEMYNKLKS